jgi:predicted transcriptional regulator
MPKKPVTIALHPELTAQVDRLALFLNISRSELIGRILEGTVPRFLRRDVHSVTLISQAFFEEWGRE